MALQTYPTLTPSGYLTFSVPPSRNSDPSGVQPAPYSPVANTQPLPAGSTPDKALITNVGSDSVFVVLTTAAKTTTATAAVGATVLTVASATSIAVGQAVLATGVPDGTFVTSVSGTAIGISQPVTAALSTTTINFVAPVTSNTGNAIAPNGVVSLAYGSNTFVSAICGGGSGRAVVNVAVGV